jgi:hypothetical protein
MNQEEIVQWDITEEEVQKPFRDILTFKKSGGVNENESGKKNDGVNVMALGSFIFAGVIYLAIEFYVHGVTTMESVLWIFFSTIKIIGVFVCIGFLYLFIKSKRKMKTYYYELSKECLVIKNGNKIFRYDLADIDAFLSEKSNLKFIGSNMEKDRISQTKTFQHRGEVMLVARPATNLALSLNEQAMIGDDIFMLRVKRNCLFCRTKIIFVYSDSADISRKIYAILQSVNIPEKKDFSGLSEGLISRKHKV